MSSLLDVGSNPNFIAGIQQGLLDKNSPIFSQFRSRGSNFYPIVILDVICDPTEVNKNKVEYWQNILKVSNVEYASQLPRNSVIGQRLGESSNPMFFFHFFHLTCRCRVNLVRWFGQ